MQPKWAHCEVKFVFRITAQGRQVVQFMEKKKKSQVLSLHLRPSACFVWDDKLVRERRFTGEIMEQGCKSKTGKVLFDFEPHSHISYMKALSDRQTCLVALRYDDAAVDVSADTVTHTHCPIWKTNLREQRYTHTHRDKHTLWCTPPSTGTPASGKDVETSLRKIWTHTNI